MAEHSLLRAARARVVIADGAMGTELQHAGLLPGACGELWNVDHPDRVTAIHRRYRDAGAEVLLTNTFGSSRFGLARHGLEDRAAELTRCAVQAARDGAGFGAWVLGDIGPFGGFLEPVGDTPVAEAFEVFGEQAKALVHGGVDGIIVETMAALDELLLAIRAARDAGATLVIGSVAFDATKAGIRTMTGATPEEAARALRDAGVDILGANCGTGLGAAEYADIVRRYRAVAASLPVMVKPNAGQPHLRGEALSYDETAERMAASARQLVDAGAAIVGGCCGTTPDHIRAIAGALRSRSAVGNHVPGGG